jgi:hypothetical protein
VDAETRRLDSAILSFIGRHAGRPASEAEFNRLALQIFRYQFARNRAYRRWCLREQKTPDTVRGWKEIPAVPAEAFKRLRLATFPPAAARKVFRTSGTTGPSRGRHFFDSLALYEASIVPPFRRRFLGDGAKPAYYFLISAPSEAPDSSLSHMMGVVNRRFAAGRGKFYVRRGTPDYVRLASDLSRENRCVFLLSTAFALKGFLDYLQERGLRLKLASGSRLMETGGFKGRITAVSKQALYASCRRLLGIAPGRIGSEYGMTELSSQYYDGLPPAWLRAVVVDPRTGAESPRGSAGLLRHVDLANRGSVLAVETQDVGRATARGIVLIGRAPDAERRGCSLAFEAFLKR